MEVLKRISLTDAAVESLKEMILSGDLQVGEKMPSEQQLCINLGVSRSTIREALRVLQAMNYIEMIPGRGAFITKSSQEDQDIQWVIDHSVEFQDFMQVRVAIESLAVQLSAQKITGSQLQELQDTHQAFTDAVESRDIVKMMMLDEVYHSKIMESTGNKLLISINKKMLEVFRKYRVKSFAQEGMYRNALIPHQAVLDALQRHDVESAIRAIEEHLAITKKDMIGSVEGKIDLDSN